MSQRLDADLIEQFAWAHLREQAPEWIADGGPDDDPIRRRVFEAVWQQHDDPEEFAAVVIALNTQLELWNASGHAFIELFPELIETSDPPGPFDWRTTCMLSAVAAMDEEALRVLRRPRDIHDTTLPGLFLWSLTRVEGVLDNNLIRIALRQVAMGRIRICGDAGWLDLPRPGSSPNPRDHLRRVYLSQTSLAVIALLEQRGYTPGALLDTQGRPQTRAWLNALRTALPQSIRDNQIDSWRLYCHCVHRHILTTVDGVSAAYARDDSEARFASIPPERLVTVLNGRPPRQSLSTDAPGQTQMPLHAPQAKLPDPLIRARRHLDRASQQSDRRSPRRRTELADQLLTLIPPGEQSDTPAVLLDWLARALAGQQPFGSAIKPKTAHDYLHNIAGPLMRGLADQPLATTTDQQLVTALETCFLEQSERLKNVQTVDNAARSLLRYLRAIHGFEPIDPGDLENWPRSLPTPRAPNFVSEREFERLLRDTDGGLPASRHTRVVQHRLCAAVLIYRGGLRISEIANLVMGQWVRDEQDTLEIRSNSWFELKTQNGKRTVPLGKLLTEQDRRYLTALLRRRQAETRNPEAPLFYNHSTGSPYTPEGLARRVRQSLRRVTHDPTMRLHALRHTCGMALFEALIRGRGQPAPTSLPTFHPWLVGGNPQALRAATARPDTSMFHLTDTSEFLGHSSDAVTSYFYLHFQDLRLANHLHAQIACPWQLISEALDVGRTRAYRLRDNNQAFLRTWTELHDAELVVREPKPDPPAYQAAQLIQAFSVGACPSKSLADSTTAYTDAI